MADPELLAVLNRIADGVESLAKPLDLPPPPVDCIRCKGEGWVGNTAIECTDCAGTGVQRE